MPRTTQCLATLAVAGFGLLLAGCGTGLREKRLPETGASIEGKVSYGKEQVMVALIIIQGEGGAAHAYVGEDGRYRADNVPLGQVHIAVNTDAGKGDFQGKLMAKAQGKGQGPLPKLIDVPAKYADPVKSGITTTINKGENKFDIVIPR
jgi:hypothetical protein